MTGITWTNDKRRLSQLIPWPRNPRQIHAKQAQRLQESLTEFGQPEVIAIGPGNQVYNGHQRLKAWAQAYGDIDWKRVEQLLIEPAILADTGNGQG